MALTHNRPSRDTLEAPAVSSSRGEQRLATAYQSSRAPSATAIPALQSPYPLDSRREKLETGVDELAGRTVFFDGVFKGDYSLAIVNRHIARALSNIGIKLVLHCPEVDWQLDSAIEDMPDVRRLFTSDYPVPGVFDIHMRNTWPPRADDMVGAINAYVCFGWEEVDFPNGLVDHFNTHLDLVMVNSNFTGESLRNSGVNIPIEVVGLGCDHVLASEQLAAPAPPTTARKRF